jgi:transcriptional regulator with GAF, ATPase, and Fis domain
MEQGGAISGPFDADSIDRHLRVLRDLLQRDYIGRADWSYTLRDLAEMAKEALQAREALVALYDPEARTWLACTSGGRMLADSAISRHGSRAVLDRVRDTGLPVLSTGGAPLDMTSESIRRHQLTSVLAIPLYWWDIGTEGSDRRFAGCLYAHRSRGDGPFTDKDAELVLDITRIAQPSLNALRHLRDVSSDLEAGRQLVQGLGQTAARLHRLGQYETQDPRYAKNVLEVLQGAAHADKVGLLLLGPTGSGKSTLAEAYHHECPRRRGPFVVLDCAQATSEQTLAAELFGYAPRSGFANAPPGGRPGAAELAHRGTLFIDEIGTLPLGLQQKLLTLIQTGAFSPLGSSERRQVDIQVIAATNEDLDGLVRERRFREDLYWRISMVTVRLPPLSERRVDVPRLASGFLRSACVQFGRAHIEGFSDAALERLRAFDWSRAGNIRGLEHTVYRSVLLAPPGTKRLEAGDLVLQSMAEEPRGQEPRSGPGDGAAAPGAIDSAELSAIKTAIREHGYATAAARALGITYDALIWQLRKAGLSVRDVLAR